MWCAVIGGGLIGLYGAGNHYDLSALIIVGLFWGWVCGVLELP